MYGSGVAGLDVCAASGNDPSAGSVADSCEKSCSRRHQPQCRPLGASQHLALIFRARNRALWTSHHTRTSCVAAAAMESVRGVPASRVNCPSLSTTHSLWMRREADGRKQTGLLVEKSLECVDKLTATCLVQRKQCSRNGMPQVFLKVCSSQDGLGANGHKIFRCASPVNLPYCSLGQRQKVNCAFETSEYLGHEFGASSSAHVCL